MASVSKTSLVAVHQLHESKSVQIVLGGAVSRGLYISSFGAQLESSPTPSHTNCLCLAHRHDSAAGRVCLWMRVRHHG